MNNNEAVQPVVETSLTVGETFVLWAEKYWKLEEIFKKSVKETTPETQEQASYSHVKQAFATFIDKEINNRIAGK